MPKLTTIPILLTILVLSAMPKLTTILKLMAIPILLKQLFFPQHEALPAKFGVNHIVSQN